MSFAFVQMRPYGDKRGSWVVLDSRAGREVKYRDYDLARIAVYQLGFGLTPILLVVFDHRGEPESAFKSYPGGKWQKLKMLISDR